MNSVAPPDHSRADMTESKRLFMALPIPTPIRQQLKDFQKPLQAMDLPVKWQSGKLLHLTLAFLGQQPADRLQDLTTILENVSREARRYRQHDVNCRRAVRQPADRQWLFPEQ